MSNEGYMLGMKVPSEMGYVTKDSGERVEFESGMRRDTDKGKPRYDLIPILPLRRLADLYARGAEKYDDNNWMKANSPEELQRFKASFLRHAYQALNGETDEDHWAGAIWNAFAIIWLEDKLSAIPMVDPEFEALLAEEEEIERRRQEIRKQQQGTSRFEINEGRFNEWAKAQREAR